MDTRMSAQLAMMATSVADNAAAMKRLEDQFTKLAESLIAHRLPAENTTNSTATIDANVGVLGPVPGTTNREPAIPSSLPIDANVGVLGPVPGTSNREPALPSSFPILSKSGTGTTFQFTKIPKIDFPIFSGTNVRNWVHKANRYFQFHPVADNQKVLLASLYLQDRAEAWYQAGRNHFQHSSWLQFTSLIQSRFSEDLCENIIGEFNKLCQASTVEDYQSHFEALQSLVLLKQPHLSEEYFIASFISGLREDIKKTVQMFRPSTIAYAISLAKLQEATLDLTNNTSTSTHKTPTISSAINPNYTSTPYKASTTTIPPSPAIPLTKLSAQEMLARRDKGLCYNCDEPYTFGHRCQSKQLFVLTTEECDPEADPPTAEPPP